MNKKVVSFNVGRISFDRAYIARPKNKVKNTKMLCLCKNNDTYLKMGVYIFRKGCYECILKATIHNNCECDYKFTAKSKNTGVDLVTMLEPSYAMGMAFAVAEKEYFADDQYDDYRDKDDIQYIHDLFHSDYRIEEDLGNVHNKYYSLLKDRKIG